MSASPRPKADGADDGQKAARCHTTGPERSARSMSTSDSNSAPAEHESTDTDAPTDHHLRCDHGCTPAFPAAACYIDERVRGLPAVVPVSRSASDIEWEARA